MRYKAFLKFISNVVNHNGYFYFYLFVSNNEMNRYTNNRVANVIKENKIQIYQDIKLYINAEKKIIVMLFSY